MNLCMLMRRTDWLIWLSVWFFWSMEQSAEGHKSRARGDHTWMGKQVLSSILSLVTRRGKSVRVLASVTFLTL